MKIPDALLRGLIAGNDQAHAVSEKNRWLGGTAYWICQCAFWGFIAVFWLLGSVSDGEAGGWMLALRHLSFASAGMVATHGLRLLITEVRERVRSTWSLIFWVFAATVAATSLMLILTGVAVWSLPVFRSATSFYERFNLSRFMRIEMLLVTWTGFYFAIKSQRRYQKEYVARLQLDAALREAEVHALKAQINPHFLFNCLNSLRALVPLEQARPREAITLLADLLRAALTVNEQLAISLRQEMETVETYLALEKIRFEDRLQIIYEIAPETRERQVPPFLVQMLVENAVKHGIAPREEGGVVTIRSELRDGLLCVQVENPGKIMAATNSTGLGLNNVKVRLRHLFGPDAAVTLRQAGDDLVVAEAVIPGRLLSLRA